MLEFDSLEEMRKSIIDAAKKEKAALDADNGVTKSSATDAPKFEVKSSFDNMSGDEIAAIGRKCIGIGIKTKGNIGQIRSIKESYGDPIVRKAADVMTKSVSALSAAEGGFFIPRHVEKEVLRQLLDETVMDKAGIKVVPYDNYEYAIQDRMLEAEFVGENETGSESEMSFRMRNVTTQKMTAKASIYEDAIWGTDFGWVDEMFGQFQIACRQKIDVAEMRGVQTPAGGIKGLASSAIDANKIKSKSADFLSPANPIQAIQNDAVKCMNALVSRNIPNINRGWIMSPLVLNNLKAKLNDVSSPVWPSLQGDNPTWFGAPVYTSNSIPSNLATKRVSGEDDYTAANSAGNVFSEIYYVEFSLCRRMAGNVGTGETLRIDPLGRHHEKDSLLRYRCVTKPGFFLLREGQEVAILQDVQIELN